MILLKVCFKSIHFYISATKFIELERDYVLFSYNGNNSTCKIKCHQKLQHVDKKHFCYYFLNKKLFLFIESDFEIAVKNVIIKSFTFRKVSTACKDIQLYFTLKFTYF